MEIGYNEWLALIIGVILMMTGSQLFRGKWLFLIAGYNTLSQSDKEKLNSKFIGKIKGKTVWFICQILLIIIAMIYVNSSKRKNQ